MFVEVTEPKLAAFPIYKMQSAADHRPDSFAIETAAIIVDESFTFNATTVMDWKAASQVKQTCS